MAIKTFYTCDICDCQFAEDADSEGDLLHVMHHEEAGTYFVDTPAETAKLEREWSFTAHMCRDCRMRLHNAFEVYEEQAGLDALPTQECDGERPERVVVIFSPIRSMSHRVYDVVDWIGDTPVIYMPRHGKTPLYDEIWEPAGVNAEGESFEIDDWLKDGEPVEDRPDYVRFVGDEDDAYFDVGEVYEVDSWNLNRTAIVRVEDVASHMKLCMHEGEWEPAEAPEGRPEYIRFTSESSRLLLTSGKVYEVLYWEGHSTAVVEGANGRERCVWDGEWEPAEAPDENAGSVVRIVRDCDSGFEVGEEVHVWKWEMGAPVIIDSEFNALPLAPDEYELI